MFAVVGMVSSSVSRVATAAAATFQCRCFLFEACALFFVLGVFVEEVACCYEFEATEDDHVDGAVRVLSCKRGSSILRLRCGGRWECWMVESRAMTMMHNGCTVSRVDGKMKKIRRQR